jgi:hypothetical protein
MVDVKQQGAARYHVETLPDGRQVMVNNDTGMIAVTDPATGIIVREVPKTQYPPGVTNPGPQPTPSSIYQPTPTPAPAANGPAQYPPGVTNPAPRPSPPGVYQPTTPYTPGGQPAPATGGTVYPKGVTNTGGGAPATGPATGTTTGGPVLGPARPAPGTPGYEQWVVNDMLRSGGYEGWQMVGVQPIQVQDTKVNPLYDPTNPDPTVSATLTTPKNEYIVNARNPQTNEIKQFTLSKTWQGADGSTTQDDPGPGAQFSYTPTGIKDVQTKDQLGHTGLMTIGGVIWGTNTGSGVFEPVPGAPTVPQNWTEVRQVDNKDGSTSWVGIDPKDPGGGFKPVPGLPTIPAANKGWGDPKPIPQPDGSTVYYGTDPTDHVFKPMPGMAPIPAAPKGPGSITQKGTVYVQKADGTYAPAAGVPDANLPKGEKQLILAPDGYLYQQISRGDGTFDPDSTFTPIPFTDAAKQAHANVGAIHQAGEPGTKVINGKIYHVTYRGGSDDAYDVDTTQPATPMPGASEPTSIATSTDQPKIAQRMPDGSVQWVENQNYTAIDPAQRSAQLAQMASSKITELQAKIGTGGYTQDQAQRDYDQWWDSTMEPAKAEIQQAQQQKQIDTQLKLSAEQRAQDEQQRANYATAQAAGSNAVEAYKAQLPNMVGPGFGKAFGQLADAWTTGKPATGIDWSSALTYQMPDLTQLSQQVTNQALAHLSPTAAAGMSQAAGVQAQPGLPTQAPNYDYTQALQRNRYQLPGATTTVAPDGTVTVNHGTPPPAAAPPPPPVAAQQTFPGLAQGTGPYGLLPYSPLSPAMGTAPLS